MEKRSLLNQYTKSLFILLSTGILLFSLFLPVGVINAQSDDVVVYDYVILIDTSGSMNDGTPPLFGEVQRVSQDFVRAIQEGSNLILYSFDTTFTRIGSWQKITSSDKDKIINTIGAMEAKGQNTALWDAVCDGLAQMEVMGKSGGQHIQLLISYTDGKDNYSRVDPQTCLNKYQEMQKDGYSYWIYNAIGGVGIPDEIYQLKDIIGIVDSDTPLPIRVVHVLPLQLNLGNLYLTGKSDPQNSCLVFWASSQDDYGKEILLSEPPSSDRTLPSGTTAMICGNDQNCQKSIEISTSKSCLNFELVNFNNENLSAENLGEYVLTLPLQIPYTEPADRIFLIPNKIKLSFSLDLPPTPTPNPTATPTALPTATTTPMPPDTILKCAEGSVLDAGMITLDRNLPVTSKEFACTLEWKEYLLPQSIEAEIIYDEDEKDNQLLGQYVELTSTGGSAQSVTLNEQDQQFSVLVQIPKTDWDRLGNGKKTFSGEIRLVTQNTNLIGDFENEESVIPIEFSIKKEKSILVYIIPAAIILLIGLSILIGKWKENSKPPKFDAILSYEINGVEVRKSLMDIKPVAVSKNHVKIVVGQGESCQIKLPANPNFGLEYFSLHAEKSKSGVEISIQPVEFVRVNMLPVTTSKVLKSRDIIETGDLKFSIFINNHD